MNKLTLNDFTLKGIKHYASLSEETYCYQATLYFKGKAIAKVSNSGRGGADKQEPINGWTHQRLQELSERINKEIPAYESKYPNADGSPMLLDYNLEFICANLVTQYLTLKDLKKNMKGRIVFIQDDEVHSVRPIGSIKNKLSNKPLPPEFAHLVSLKYPDSTVLNGLSDKELLAKTEGILY